MLFTLGRVLEIMRVSENNINAFDIQEKEMQCWKTIMQKKKDLGDNEEQFRQRTLAILPTETKRHNDHDILPFIGKS